MGRVDRPGPLGPLVPLANGALTERPSRDEKEGHTFGAKHEAIQQEGQEPEVWAEGAGGTRSMIQH